MIYIVGRGDRGDGCETGVKKLLVACFLLTCVLIGGRIVWVVIGWVRDAFAVGADSGAEDGVVVAS